MTNLQWKFCEFVVVAEAVEREVVCPNFFRRGHIDICLRVDVNGAKTATSNCSVYILHSFFKSWKGLRWVSFAIER